MKMRNVLSNSQAGKGIASSPITHVSGDSADYLNPVSLSGINDRPSTDAIDRDSVNQISVTPFLPSADNTGEEAERAGSKSGKPEPTNLLSDSKRDTSWEEWYRI